jgi:hypothetical protein
MANAPLLGTGWHELVEMICPTSKVEYFFEKGWTLICPTGGNLPAGHSMADKPLALAMTWMARGTRLSVKAQGPSTSLREAKRRSNPSLHREKEWIASLAMTWMEFRRMG